MKVKSLIVCVSSGGGILMKPSAATLTSASLESLVLITCLDF